MSPWPLCFEHHLVSLRQSLRVMKTILTLTAVFAASLIQAADLKVGDAAPDFALQGSDGKTYKLSAFRGKQAVVIAWYPKAFTGG